MSLLYTFDAALANIAFAGQQNAWVMAVSRFVLHLRERPGPNRVSARRLCSSHQGASDIANFDHVSSEHEIAVETENIDI